MKTGQSELMTVLDEERAVAVIEHRAALKKRLTAYAAKLLAKRLSRCPDPAAAADYMIERGWLSIEPDWLPKPKQDPFYTEYERWSNSESEQRTSNPGDGEIIPPDDSHGWPAYYLRGSSTERH